MSNLALSLPSSTIFPGRDNLKIIQTDHTQVIATNSTDRYMIHQFINSPEKVRLSIELEISSINVKVKLRRSGVGHTDSEDQVFRILAQVECRSYHCEY